jgi:hypothetical protein
MAAMMSQSDYHVHQVTGGMTLAQRDIQAATTSQGKEMEKNHQKTQKMGFLWIYRCYIVIMVIYMDIYIYII